MKRIRRLSALETKRQLVHLLVGISIAALLYAWILDATRLVILLVIGIVISFASKKVKLPVVWWFLKELERPEVLKTFPGKGTLYFVFGALVSVLLFERDIALASIAILTIGDSVAPLAGQFGKIPHPFSGLKSTEGLVAGIVGGFAGALLFVHPLEALAASVFAMLAEGIEFRVLNTKVDDNLVVPLAAGFAIAALRLFR